MRFYTKAHAFFWGVDLHARSMYVCVLDPAGKVRFHEELEAGPRPFLAAIEPFREDVAVAVECIFTWYWLADLSGRSWPSRSSTRSTTSSDSPGCKTSPPTAVS